jgi:alpha-tubulin suppressor-like RCC1 family protein
VVVTGISNATTVSVGNGFACALLATGAIQCWGANSYGQLGNGDNTDSVTPVDVTALINRFALAAGGNHVCALGVGQAHCWGWNYSGQLGDGSTTDSNVPIPVFGMH